MKADIRNIVVIGSGNIAYHMIRAFVKHDIHIMQILAHNERTASQLSQIYKIPYILDPSEIERDADMYLIAVQDDHIAGVAKSLHMDNQLLVHTSGFSSIDILSGASHHSGVFWPLQTFTFGVDMTYDDTPFIIEGNTIAITERLEHLAGLISDKVIIADSPTRQKIHLAAVIASNLTNHLYSISAGILEKDNIPFDVLGPLIRETAAKVLQNHPDKSQTGPAARKDIKVIEKHLAMLRDDPEYQMIYRILSESIMKLHQHK